MKHYEAERISSLPVRTLGHGSNQRDQLARGIALNSILATLDGTIGAVETEACLTIVTGSDYTTSPGSVQTTQDVNERGGGVEGVALHKKTNPALVPPGET
jgi:hypothetical protein